MGFCADIWKTVRGSVKKHIKLMSSAENMLYSIVNAENSGRRRKTHSNSTLKLKFS